MSLFGALNTAVGGLAAQSAAFGNIAENVANSQTVGYKEVDTSFSDYLTVSTASVNDPGSVIAKPDYENNVQGTVTQSVDPLNLAVSGQGFFQVSKPTADDNGQVTFSPTQAYTRAGDFQMNQNGYLVNGAGYYLQGVPINPATGAPSGSSPQVLQFNNNFVPAAQTTAITYQANLPSAPGTGMLVPSDFEANPLAGAPLAASIVGTGATLSPDALAVGTGQPETVMFEAA